MLKQALEQEINKIEFNKNTSVSDKGKLFKRARAKFFTRGIILNLIDMDSKLKKSYWNTYHCAGTLKQEGNKITSRYCKNRWCMVCNRIRTAVLINKYVGTIKKWDDKFFVTLTVRNVKADLLEKAIDEMSKEFVLIKDVMRKRKMNLIGFRKLECTYNPERSDYHPHFHFLVRGKDNADFLLSEWLKRYPADTDEQGQNVKPADDNSVMDLFKYFTKIISSNFKKNNESIPIELRGKIFIHALDVIFKSVQGHRVFQNFGFKGEKIDEKQLEKQIEDVIEEKISDTIQYFTWENELSDWVCRETGELKTGYIPSEGMKKLLIDGIVVKKPERVHAKTCNAVFSSA